jgi:uncharacterized membrane protein YhfC
MKSPAVLAVLLVLGAGLVAAGVTLERSLEAGEHTEAAEAQEHAGADEREPQARVLGIEIESPATVAAMFLASAVLALIVWRRPSRSVLLTVLVFSLVFALFDGRELIFQRGALMAVASAAAVIHLLAAIVAGWMLRPSEEGRS